MRHGEIEKAGVADHLRERLRVKLQHGGPAKSQTRVWKYTETKTGEEIALRCDSSGNPYTLECIDTKFVPVRAIVRASDERRALA